MISEIRALRVLEYIGCGQMHSYRVRQRRVTAPAQVIGHFQGALGMSAGCIFIFNPSCFILGQIGNPQSVILGRSDLHVCLRVFSTPLALINPLLTTIEHFRQCPILTYLDCQDIRVKTQQTRHIKYIHPEAYPKLTVLSNFQTDLTTFTSSVLVVKEQGRWKYGWSL